MYARGAAVASKRRCTSYWIPWPCLAPPARNDQTLPADTPLSRVGAALGHRYNVTPNYFYDPSPWVADITMVDDMGKSERLSASGENDPPGADPGKRGTAHKFDFQETPEGLTKAVHEINLLIGNILLETHACYFWLNRTKNLDSAKRTTSKLAKRAEELEAMIYKLDAGAVG